MATILTVLGKGKISMFNTNEGAKIGPWCKSPLIPDRCENCFDPKTMLNYPAEGYREETDPDGEIWRHGTCHRCKTK